MSAIAETASLARAASIQRVAGACGVEAWLVEDYAVPLVALEFAFDGGAGQDTAAKAGCAAMLAALLDEGAGDLDSAAFQEALDEKAIELSFSADRDALYGRLRTLARHTDAAFDLLRLAINAPRLDESAIDRVRAQIEAGLRREANDPDAAAGKAFRAAAFPNHPYGRPPRGSLLTIAAIERADLTAMRTRMFARRGVKLAVVGAIDAQRLAPLIERVFADLPAANGLAPVADIQVQAGARCQTVDIDVPQTTLRFGVPGIARKDPDFMAAALVNHILGGGVFSARLFKEVREKRGLAYSVYTQLSTADHTAMLSGGTSTKNDRAKESLDVIEAEIARLAAEGPTEDELEKAKKFLIGSYPLRFDTSTKIAGELLSTQRQGFAPAYLDERLALIAAVSLEDAKRVARRLFAGQRLLVAAAGRPIGFSS